MPIEETLPAPVDGAPSTQAVSVPEESAKPSDAPTPDVESEHVNEVGDAARTMALRVRDGLKSGAAQSAITVKKGLASAQAKLAAEERAWDARSARSDLPAISHEMPLFDLATRLDRQAGFFRELAVDAMRPTVSRHVLHAVVIALAGLSGVLGIALTWQVLTGNESPMFVATSALAAGSALLAIGVAFLLERNRMVLARASLAHAAQAEDTLERIAQRLAQKA